MSGPDLVPMFHGVRTVVGGPGDWLRLPDEQALQVRCRALLRVTPDGTFFGGITPARLWGLPLPPTDRYDDRLHTVLWYPGQPTNRVGVIGRQINDWNAHRVEVDGLPTIDLLTPLAQIRLGAESRPETLLRLLLLEAGFREPELNVRLYDRFGTELARVDLLFREFRVVVEYDGDQHRTDTRQFDRDLGRLDDLAALGWRVVRIGGRNLFGDPQDAVNRVRRALSAGGWVSPDPAT